VSNPQFHEVVTCELLAGQAIARFLIHLPRPRQIFVGNPLVTEASIGLPPHQHIPDQFQNLPRDCHDRLVPMHPFLQSFEPHLQQGIRLHCPLCRFHQRHAQIAPARFRDLPRPRGHPALMHPRSQSCVPDRRIFVHMEKN